MDQYITTRPSDKTWVVRAGGAVIAESRGTVELSEGDLPPVIYFPREDIAMMFLEQTSQTSSCPHKGEAVYFSIMAKSYTLENAGWSYENPKPEAERIKGMIAFYAKGLTIEQL
ncbi:MAG: DUF427 domain-containing protein [Mangrovicoccus sp.]